jgi:uncharacterized protein (DUF433 family)
MTTEHVTDYEALTAEQLEQAPAEAERLELIDEIFLMTRRGN